MNVFRLDTFQEAKAKGKFDEIGDSDNPMPGPKDIDYDYMAKIEQYRPAGAYYEHSHGDKLLYMKKVDRIEYDLVEAHRLRKE